MYDVMNFGCIPVVLSDDLVWAFSKDTGGVLDHTQYSIQLPQCVVQLSTPRLLEKYKDHKENFGSLLPSGDSMYYLLEQAYHDHGDYIGDIYVNPLVQILQRISFNNIELLRVGVERAAPKYHYYKMFDKQIKNPTNQKYFKHIKQMSKMSRDEFMKTIPTAIHSYPDGDALILFSDMLMKRKEYGLAKLRDECYQERIRPGHKYISRFPCSATGER
jgi:hypothetical protein